MKERQKTVPPKLKLIAESINEAMREAKLEKIGNALEHAKKEIAATMRKR